MYSENGLLAICSEAKGLQKLKFTGSIPKVQTIEPGTVEEYKIEKNGLPGKAVFMRKHKFHVIGNFPKYDVNVKLGENILENIRASLTNAVRMRLMSHRRIGCLLSGGLDSSLVTGLMVREARKAGINYPIQSFSIGMGDESPDVIAARKVCI